MDEFAVSREQVEAERDEVMLVNIEGGSRYPAMTYEKGIEAALAWILGDQEERPYSD